MDDTGRMDWDDQELIEKAQQGDMRAFEEVIARYDRKVMGIAMHYASDLDDAKDIYQEVFLRVYRALPKFRFRAKFSTWLFRVTTNCCLSHVEKKSRDWPLSSEGDLSPYDTDANPLERHPVVSVSAEADAYGKEIGDQIRKAMGALSPQQKLVFVLRHYEGYKLREIASFLDCAEGTVKKHLFTATERMREQLRELVV